MSMSNARRETIAKSWTFAPAWRAGQRCLIPVESWVEPYWGLDSRNVWWSFRRVDGHPVLSMMHRPGKEKRGVVTLEPGDWDAWLHGTAARADALIKLPPLGVPRSGAEKPEEENLLPAEQLVGLKAEG